MKILKTKSKIAIALVSIFTLSALLITTLPIANALELTTHTYNYLRPNPIGVGQTVLVEIWLDKMPPVIHDWVVDPFPYVTTITKPDGTTETKKISSDPVGGAYFEYTPATVGTYTFQTKMTGLNRTGQPFQNNYWLPSISTAVTLTVQDEDVATWPNAPLPTEYWTRPIEAENREWAPLAGDWLQSSYDQSLNNFNPYTTGPESAHIMWTKPITFGGVAGSYLGDKQFYTGQSYEGKWMPPLVMQGRLIYWVRSGTTFSGTACLDIRTGEEIWFLPNILINAGQLYSFDSGNQHGVMAYLWTFGSTYRMYDAYNGGLMIEIPNATADTAVIDHANGDLLVYVLDGFGNRLIKWNSTKCILAGQPTDPFSFATSDFWRPSSQYKYNWAQGIVYNVSVPDMPGSQGLFSGSGSLMTSEVIVAVTVDSTVFPPRATLVGYNTATGTEIWRVSQTLKEDPGAWTYGGGTAIGDGVYASYIKELEEWVGNDLQNGQQLWITDPRVGNDWGVYSSGRGASIAYGKLYSGAYDGKIYAYDVKTGETLWTYYAGNAGFETPYGSWPFMHSIGAGMSVADGKIYAPTGEHSPNSPTYRGWRMHVIDAETGEGIWNILGYFQNPVIADGYVLSLNGYDNQIYCFGKGQTAVTVAAPDVATTLGTPVVIKGTVTDQSPGAKGAAAISDESMTPWMEYLYMQKPMPTNATGVEVLINVLDSNGNFRNIGKTTADSSGFYHFTWEPDISGDFKVVATFAGSKSYYASSSETAFTVMEAPAATPELIQAPASLADQYMLPGIGIIVIAIAVVGALILLMLRKR